MGAPIATVGCRFEGSCSACDGAWVGGTLISGEPNTSINGNAICATGSIGRGDCGHTCTVVGQSAIVSINGHTLARVGDPVTGTINGRITTGVNQTTSD